MKQVIRKGIRDIIVDEVPDPVTSPHSVLIRPVFSLISSGTETASIHQEAVVKEVAENPSYIRKVWEVSKVNGPVRTAREVLAKLSTEYAALGYCGAGLLADKHETVTDLEIGERVAYGGEGTGHAETVQTGRNLVVPIPENVPFEHACFATLGSIALNAVRIAQCHVGDTIAVIGLGVVGQLISQLARVQGAIVAGIDLRADRMALAQQLGAQHVFEPDFAADALMGTTDSRGVDCVFIAAAAKSDAPCRQAIRVCRDRGRIVVVGAVDLSFPWNEMYMKEIQLLMSRAYGPGSYDSEYERGGRDYPFSYVRWTENRNMQEVLRLISTGQLRVDPLITHRFDLEDGPKAYQTIMNPSLGSLAVLLKYSAASEPALAFEPRPRVELAVKQCSSQKIGVALIGAGNIARWMHLPALKKISEVKLRAVYSSNPVRSKGYAARFGAEFCTTDYEEILNDPRTDLVVIASRNNDHAPQALAALRAGKHVFVEKPMALSAKECQDLEAAVKASGKQLTVGFNRRFAPYYKPFKKHLKGRSGPAVVSCVVNSPGISGNYWMADPSIGGAILGDACHFVDLMRWMLESDPVSVSAYHLPVAKKEPIGENNLVASFLFKDGSIGNLTYCTIGSKTSGGERVEVFLSGLSISSKDFKELVTKSGVRRRSRKMFADKGYNEQMRSFIKSIQTGKTPEVTFRDGTWATITCLKMLEAARDRAVVLIDLTRELHPPE